MHDKLVPYPATELTNISGLNLFNQVESIRDAGKPHDSASFLQAPLHLDI
jgi:hypothetical protein